MPGANASASTTAAAVSTSRTVVVDTDMAADDIIALAYLLSDPSMQVEGITVVGSGEVHCPIGARHVQALAAAVHHAPIPVACGNDAPAAGSATFPDAWRAQADSFYGMARTWPEPTGWPSVGNDPVALVRELAARSPLTIVALGPLTTVASVVSDPQLRAKVQAVVVSGGVVDEIGNMPSRGRTIPVREWNLGVDPVAAERVMQSGVPITMVTLNATDQAPLDVRLVDALRSMPRNAGGEALLAFLDANAPLARGGFYLWDPVAAATAVEARVATVQAMSLSILTSGDDAGRLTVAGGDKHINVTTKLDLAQFTTTLLNAFAAPGKHAGAYPSVTAAVSVSRKADGTFATTVGAVDHGTVAFAFNAAEGSGFGVAVLRLNDGHTLADLSRLVARGVTQPPSWSPLQATVDVPPGASPIWEIDLSAGRYALIGANRQGTGLTALREFTVR